MIQLLPKFSTVGKACLLLFLSLVFNLGALQAQNYNEMIKAVASDRATDDQFAYDVAIAGDYAVIGAPREDQDADGNNTMSTAGSAYIFKRDGMNWTQVQKIVPSDRGPADQFGWSVAITEDYIIVGAYKEDHDVNGVNTKSSAGSAYIFEKNSNGVWVESQKIVSSDRAAFDFFGFCVAISGDRAIIGAYNEDEDVNGNNTLIAAGSAYIFEKNNGVWTEVQKIVASDRDLSDFFGRSVAISGDHIIVSSFYEDEDVNGNNTLSSSGSAYIFERNNAGNWTEVQKIVSSDRAINDFFGISVAISGDYAVVGAHYDDNDIDHEDSGGAYVFKRDNSGTWTQTQKLISDDKDTKDYFGKSVSISGDYLMVGAHYEDEDLNGNNNLNISGAAYIFKKDDADNWNQLQKIVASDRGAGDRFGSSVAISGDNVIVGAYLEDQDVNNANTLSKSGSAYIFMKEEVLFTEAVKENNTTITVRFNVNVQTEENNASDFIVTDLNGNLFAVTAQNDVIAGDNEIVLTVNNLSSATDGILLYYINNNDEIKNLSGSAIMETDLVGVPVGAAFTTTYAAGAWDNGIPNGSFIAIIKEDFTSTTNFDCYSLQVDNGINFHLDGHKVNVTSDFVLENDASFLDEGNLTAKNSIVRRTMSSNSLSEFHLLSSPLSNGNVEKSFQGSYAYRYVGSEYDNVYSFDNGATIVNGEGLAISGTAGGVVERTYSGTFNKNTITYDLISIDQWHLLGNPYPIPLNLSTFYTNNITSIKPTFYFYNEMTGSYDTWNTELNFGTGSATSSAAIAQGFFAVEQNSSASQVTYEPSMRNLAANVFLRTAATENTGKLKLNLNGAETLIAWTPNASNEEDILDAPYLQGTANKGIYSLQNNNPLAIQAIHSDFHSKIIPIAYYAEENSTNSISIDVIDTANAIDIIIIDHYTNTTHDLNNAAYAFSNTGTDAIIEDRFELVLINNSLSIAEQDKNNAVRIITGTTLEVYSTQNSTIEAIQIHSINGRLIHQETNISNKQYSWDANTASGVYLLSIETENETIYRKVLLQ